MPVYHRIKGSISLGVGDEADFEVECPECKCMYCPRDPHTGGFDLSKGVLFIVECPRCEHGVIVRQLNEAIDDS